MASSERSAATGLGHHLIVALGGSETRIPFTPGPSVREILDATSLRVRSSCGGVGACGQCRIKIEHGEVTPPTATELCRLGQGEIGQGVRLACQVRPLQEVRLSMADPALSSNWRSLLEAEYLPEWSGTGFMRRQGESGYGVAVDLGTTQIRVSLLELSTGRRVAGRLGLNPQRVFGADVLSRLLAAADSAKRAEEIGGLAVTAIGEALADITAREGLDPKAIRQVAIVGNTPMLCLLTARNQDLLLMPDNWMREVDCPVGETNGWCAAWGVEPGIPVQVVQPLAGFVGSDLLAGVLATGLTQGPPGSLLIDFGTNSEMALWDGMTVWVTSAAGGPAFEGCGISCGMPAEPGAIYRACRLGEDSALEVSVLGGGTARGICGSGLVDMVAALLGAGELKQNGRFLAQGQGAGAAPLRLPQGITLNSQDIDALQRAKAAIGAGIQCLAAQSGLRVQDLRRVCVCGAFGRYLDIGNGQAIGLLPAIQAEGVELCGNTALAGCEMILVAARGSEVLEPIRKRCRILNLSVVQGFDDRFVENLYLRPIPMGN